MTWPRWWVQTEDMADAVRAPLCGYVHDDAPDQLWGCDEPPAYRAALQQPRGTVATFVCTRHAPLLRQRPDVARIVTWTPS